MQFEFPTPITSTKYGHLQCKKVTRAAYDCVAFRIIWVVSTAAELEIDDTSRVTRDWWKGYGEM